MTDIVVSNEAMGRIKSGEKRQAIVKGWPKVTPGVMTVYNQDELGERESIQARQVQLYLRADYVPITVLAAEGYKDHYEFVIAMKELHPEFNIGSPTTVIHWE